MLITRVIPGLCYNLPGDYTVLITRFIRGLCSEACDMVNCVLIACAVRVDMMFVLW